MPIFLYSRKEENKLAKVIKVVKLRKIVIFVIIFCTIFAFLYYKNFLFGNNISKNREENKIEKLLNNTNQYNAEVEVTVTSNKTQNLYKMYQEVDYDYSMQEIKNGENTEGVKIERNHNNLKISNTKLNLEKVYENYNNLLNNAMFLDTFSNDYKSPENDINCYEENDAIILEIKLNNNSNTYIKYKKLYLDAKTFKPIKLEIKSHLKNETICIVYNNIEIKNS